MPSGADPKCVVERSVSLALVTSRQPDVLSGGDPYHPAPGSALSPDEWKAFTRALRREISPFVLPGIPVMVTNENDATVMMHTYIKAAGQDPVRRAVAKVAQVYQRDVLLTTGQADLVAGQDRAALDIDSEEDAA